MSFRCVADASAIEALVLTNPGFVVQTVNGEPYLSVSDDWFGVFLHVDPQAVDLCLDELALAGE